MLRDIFLETFYACGTILSALGTLVAFKFSLNYLRSRNGLRITVPKTSTGAVVVEPLIDHSSTDRLIEEVQEAVTAPVRVEPVRPVAVKPIKSREIQPTSVVVPPPVECAHCSKEIKAPPLKKVGGQTHYKCEHCGTTVATA